RSPPTLLPNPSAVTEYASQYLDGCHATAGTATPEPEPALPIPPPLIPLTPRPELAVLEPPVEMTKTLSPVSAWKISRPEPPQPRSSLAPTMKRPSQLQLTARMPPPPELDTVRLQTQSVVSQREIRTSLPPTAR